MRIVQVADLYPPIVGGTERHTARLAETLSKRGHHSVVITQAVSEAPPFEIGSHGERVYRLDGGWAQRPVSLRSTGLPHHPSFPDPGIARRMKRIVESEQADVVYGHNWMLYSYLAAAGRRPRPKIVTVAHDYGLVCPARSLIREDGSACRHERSGESWRCAVGHYGAVRGPLMAAGLAGSRRFLHSRIDLFLAVSDAVAIESAAAADGRTVEVMPTFIADDLAEVAELTPRPRWIPDEPYILYVGALGKFKGIQVLLRAYSALPEPRPLLVVVGTPKPDMPQEWPAGVRRLSDIPHAEVMSAWRNCLFGVVPSLWPEAFGQVAAEAHTAGRAVIVSDTGGLADVVDDGVTGLRVPPGDEKALTRAMMTLLDDPALADRMGVEARARSPRYRVSQVANDIEKRLNELIRETK